MILDAATGEVLADLLDGEFEAVKGGAGGRGNSQFTSPTRQTPDFAEPGRKGKEREISLELKLIADVGIVGMPNAGKSTLIRALSAARPKVADYPFTTLIPSLGVVRVDVNRSFVLADIPGLIEGAAEGAGLGHQFLRHLARTRVLLHLVDVAPLDEAVNPAREAKAIVMELRKYDETLYLKPRWVVLNKIDMVVPDERARAVKRFLKDFGWKGKSFIISALTGEGCRELAYAVMEHLEQDSRSRSQDSEKTRRKSNS